MTLPEALGGGSLELTREPALLAALVLLGLLGLGLAAWTGRAAGSPWLRRGELLAWGLALLVLVFSLSGPTLVHEEGKVEEGRIVVLVDNSASMRIREGERPRSEEVEEILALLPSDAEVFSFDEELRPGRPTEFQGRGTDIGMALASIADRLLGQPVRGVVLVTDGLDRGLLRAELREAAEAGQALGGHLPALPGPLTIYQVGGRREVRDQAIEDVISGGFAFLRTEVDLKAIVRGAPGETLSLSLSREGQTVQRRDAVLDAQGRAEVVFRVRPATVGRIAYELSLPVQPDDAVPGNNTVSVVLRVVRDRVRVLQVSGSPSYDTSFLRLFLKEDPSVDLVSFFILRTQEDMMSGWASDELSLIPFPYDRLFTEELGTFDIVVFQNFDYRPYFSWGGEALLENIARYVEEGGAFVMTGGDRSFDLGQYGGTPLERVLPVRLDAAGAKVDEAPLRAQPTRAGLVHPVTRLGATPEESRAIWERLPELDGYNRVGGVHPDAAVLLAHPSATLDGQPAPILALREVGRGRSMALMVDSSWRWAFQEVAAGRGNQAYLRFWKNSLRWLMADPDEQRLSLTPARDNVLRGEEIRVQVRARDPGFLPAADERVSGRILSPSGRSVPFEVRTDASGEASLDFTGEELGAHRIEANLGSARAVRGETVIAVTDRDPELAELPADGVFLQRLAQAAGRPEGYRAPGDRSAPLLDAGATRERTQRTVVSLAATPWTGLLFGSFAGAAWWMRRRAGAR